MKHSCLPDHTSRGNINRASTCLAVQVRRTTSVGKLRALGVTTAQRVAQLPDVPTLKESGYDIEYAGWVVIMAPAGTPPEVLAKLNSAVNGVMVDPAVVDRYNKQGIVIRTMSLSELPVYLRNDKERWAQVAAKAGLKAE